MTPNLIVSVAILVFVIWNSHEPEPAIRRMVVEVSLDGVTFTSLREITLTTISPQSETHLLNGVLARYVRFDILENRAGQIFPVPGRVCRAGRHVASLSQTTSTVSTPHNAPSASPMKRVVWTA